MAKKAKGDSVFAEGTITNIMKAEFAGQMVVADTKPDYRHQSWLSCSGFLLHPIGIRHLVCI